MTTKVPEALYESAAEVLRKFLTALTADNQDKLELVPLSARNRVRIKFKGSPVGDVYVDYVVVPANADAR